MEYPIRVLCVMSTLDVGGAESMVMSLFRHIDKNKVIFDFVKHSKSVGAFEKEIKRLGGRVYSAPRYRLYNHIDYVRWWEKFLKNHPEYIIIHGHFFTISSVYFKVAKKAGRVTIGHCHSTPIPANQVENHIKHFVGEYLISKIEKYTDYGMACSKNAGEWLFKKKQFVVLNNAVDTNKFKYNIETRNKYRIQFNLNNSFVLGTVANLSSVKNPMGLIDIFSYVKKRKPSAKLLWVGEGDQRNSIEKRILQEGLADSVLLLGRRKDVSELLQAMDVFLLPSYSEGLPVSAIEAQAAGLSCYISDNVTREVDVTGLCTFLSIDTPRRWADLIISKQYSREDTSELIKKSGYDIDTTTRWLQSFYMGIVNSRHLEY